MRAVINEATKFLCEQTLGLGVSEGVRLGSGLYGASIPVFKGAQELHFYLFFKPATLKVFMEAFFGHDDLDGGDLDDLCKELANQIIGKAKNLLNEKEPGAYKLGTPEFLGEVRNFRIKLDEKFTYKIKNRTFQIGYKKA